MNEECLICNAPLEYLKVGTEIECELCHRKEISKTRCTKRHFICDQCHTKGLDAIIGHCLHTDSMNPIKILNELMDMPFCHMHGPEHHTMVGAALLTACHNAGSKINLPDALKEMLARGSKVPGGVCGFWGSCGAAISAGIFMSIMSGASPLSGSSWGQANMITAKSLQDIGNIGGPRCCKRNSLLSVRAAVSFLRDTNGIELETEDVTCNRNRLNNRCIRKRCPFHPSNK